MRVIVIGGVAAGASVAAKARREIKDGGNSCIRKNRYSIFWGMWIAILHWELFSDPNL